MTDYKIADWWAPRTMAEWERMSIKEREPIAFAAVGCLIAWCTWTGPVNCLHPQCRIARGEKSAIYETESRLAQERSYGYLRHLSETQYQRLVQEFCKLAETTGEYDPWKLSWQTIVSACLWPEHFPGQPTVV